MKALLSKEQILEIIGQNSFDRYFSQGHEIITGERKRQSGEEIDINKLIGKIEQDVNDYLMELGAAVLTGDSEEQRSVKFRIACKYALLAGIHSY